MGQLQPFDGRNAVRTSVRFPMRLAVVLATEDGSLEAETVDVSANGLLFTAERLPPVGSKVVFTMTMPSAVMGSEHDVMIHCTGRIVRHQLGENVKRAAAVIDEYFLKV